MITIEDEDVENEPMTDEKIDSMASDLNAMSESIANVVNRHKIPGLLLATLLSTFLLSRSWRQLRMYLESQMPEIAEELVESIEYMAMWMKAGRASLIGMTKGYFEQFHSKKELNTILAKLQDAVALRASMENK